MFALGLSALAYSAPQEMVNGGTLKISWTDCGDASTHGKVSDVEPSTLTLGQKTTITGSGTMDEDVPGGAFDITVDLRGAVLQ